MAAVKPAVKKMLGKTDAGNRPSTFIEESSVIISEELLGKNQVNGFHEIEIIK